MPDDAPDPAQAKRETNEDAPAPTPKRKRKHPGVQFTKGNRAAVGKGRPKRDEIIDLFFEEVVGGKLADGTPFQVERRRALLERLYTSAMDTRRKDHTRLMELATAYYFGKPRERLEMSGPGGGPITSADVTAPRRKTTGESRKRLEALWAKREAYLAGAVARESNGHNGAATNGHTPGNGEGEEPGS
jgi:hypothetical protein